MCEIGGGSLPWMRGKECLSALPYYESTIIKKWLCSCHLLATVKGKGHLAQICSCSQYRSCDQIFFREFKFIQCCFFLEIGFVCVMCK